MLASPGCKSRCRDLVDGAAKEARLWVVPLLRKPLRHGQLPSFAIDLPDSTWQPSVVNFSRVKRICKEFDMQIQPESVVANSPDDCAGSSLAEMLPAQVSDRDPSLRMEGHDDLSGAIADRGGLDALWAWGTNCRNRATYRDHRRGLQIVETQLTKRSCEFVSLTQNDKSSLLESSSLSSTPARRWGCAARLLGFSLRPRNFGRSPEARRRAAATGILQ